MNIKKAFCFFEQSGTFKKEFIQLGIPAEDFDIANDYGETDRIIDLFAEIDKAFDGLPSVFDEIEGGGSHICFLPLHPLQQTIFDAHEPDRKAI